MIRLNGGRTESASVGMVVLPLATTNHRTGDHQSQAGCIKLKQLTSHLAGHFNSLLLVLTFCGVFGGGGGGGVIIRLVLG